MIKNETAIGGNTAERVGSAFEGVADAIEGIDQINEMEKAVDAVKEKLNASKQAIEQAVAALPIAQEAGDSATSVMSQAAVTDFVKKSLHSYKKEVTFEWVDKTFYNASGVLNSYSTAGKYSSVEIDLTKYIGKTLRCLYYTPNSDVIRSVIVRDDDTIMPFDSPNSEVKKLISYIGDEILEVVKLHTKDR